MSLKLLYKSKIRIRKKSKPYFTESSAGLPATDSVSYVRPLQQPELHHPHTCPLLCPQPCWGAPGWGSSRATPGCQGEGSKCARTCLIRGQKPSKPAGSGNAGLAGNISVWEEDGGGEKKVEEGQCLLLLFVLVVDQPVSWEQNK